MHKHEMKFYDGCLGYEATYCKCGYFQDNTTEGYDDFFKNL